MVEKELHSFSMEISKTEIVSFTRQNNPERQGRNIYILLHMTVLTLRRSIPLPGDKAEKRLELFNQHSGLF